MTIKQKNELIVAMTELLKKMMLVEQVQPNLPTPLAGESFEMLTVKECSKLVPGLTEHTVRMLVKQDKVRYIRCGQGARGKILVSKDSLLKYLGAICA